VTKWKKKELWVAADVSKEHSVLFFREARRLILLKFSLMEDAKSESEKCSQAARNINIYVISSGHQIFARQCIRKIFVLGGT
jgi:hypothetical protein